MSVVAATHLGMAQQSVEHYPTEVLFNQGKELFLGGNYTGAQDLLQQFASQSTDKHLVEEATYMMAVSSFMKGTPQRGNTLKAFLESYPASLHRHEVAFLIGSYHYDQKDWRTAEHWFAQSDLDYLTPVAQQDYSFRRGYTLLKLNKTDEARRYFGLLSQNSKKYRDAGRFYLGHIEYINGNYAEAMRQFAPLANHPDYREDVAFYTAQSTFFDAKFSDAIRLSEEFVSRYPLSQHSTEIYRILGNSYYRNGQPSKAVSYYQNYMAKVEEPLRGDAYYMGLSYYETGRYSDALTMFQRAVGENDALTQNAQLHLGQTYLKLNQKQQAQMAFEAASRQNFDSKVRETAMFNYALLAHQTNFSVFSESITLFENFLREFPQSAYANQVNDILAETFLTTKDYQAALNAINRISNPGRRILEAKQMVLFQLGAQEFINGNMSGAIQQFNNSIAMGDYDSDARNNAYYWRGEAHYKADNFSAAANDFSQFTQRAMTSTDNYALGWYNLGYSHFKQQNYAPAVTAFSRYINVETKRNRPEYADALNRIGDSYYFNREFTQAERYYAQAADANPAMADYAAYQRAFVLGLQRNYQGKINALNDMIRRFPESQYRDDALYEMSRAYTMVGRDGEAITTLRRLIADYPRSPLASQGGVQLGQLYYNAGNYQPSVAAYKQVIATFPGTDDARNALVSLETVYREMNDIQSYVNYANSLPGGMRISSSKQDSLTYLAAENVFMKGNKADAQNAMHRYLQSYPNGAYQSDANYYLATIAEERGDKVGALSYYRKVADAGNTRFLDNALIYTAQAAYDTKDYQQAVADYSRLASAARSATNQQIGQMGLVRTQSQLQSYHEVVRSATALLANANLSPEIANEARFLRAKAYRETNDVDNAVADWQAVSADTRNVYGAQAQYLLAQTYYSWKSYDRAEKQVKEFMQKGTPHQYWMARALIVLADIYTAKGDTFQANQYLESLKSNYKGGEADIQQMINERLK